MLHLIPNIMAEGSAHVIPSYLKEIVSHIKFFYVEEIKSFQIRNIYGSFIYRFNRLFRTRLRQQQRTFRRRDQENDNDLFDHKTEDHGNQKNNSDRNQEDDDNEAENYFDQAENHFFATDGEPQHAPSGSFKKHTAKHDQEK